MSEKPQNKLTSMSLGDHLEELRARLMKAIIGLFAGMITCLFFGMQLLNVLAMPYEKMMDKLGLPKLQTHELTEGFMVYLKTCLFFGLILSSPWVIWQIWAFVSAGLYKKEKKYIYAVAPATTILFISGSLYFAIVIAPLMMEIMAVFNNKIGFVSTNWTLKNYINTVLSMSVVFGVAFQMPVLVVFAEKMKMVTIKQLTSSRKFVILGLIIVSAMATPPDPMTLIMLAVPLYLLYEGAIIVCRVLNRCKKKNQQA
jgi:sec-independent protein translocase protein TatC